MLLANAQHLVKFAISDLPKAIMEEMFDLSDTFLCIPLRQWVRKSAFYPILKISKNSDMFHFLDNHPELRMLLRMYAPSSPSTM